MTVTFIKAQDFSCGEEVARVRIPAHMSYSGETRWADKLIDICLADIVKALVDAGIYTNGCCCGHGVAEKGSIVLTDGRRLTVEFPENWIPHS